MQIVAQVPADAQAVGGDFHQLALRAQILQKEDELEFEENHWVDRRSSARSIAVPNQFPHEREVDGSLQAAVEVVFWDELFEREVIEGREVALLGGHHDEGGASSSAQRKVERRRCYLCLCRYSSARPNTEDFFNKLVPF